ncbi:Ig-like domain-containing protein [Limimonas halophila]|uniref:Ig-like domain-containing protein n=1 Tax=Limimonas halophila TaxID=1082479 RepID=A0A1G7T1Q1_9PROT|nr:Ig-like domain-containing protein [Limimonas halophila]SDG29181.1 Ig-like domain-containing protein [Limimonas halophila]
MATPDITFADLDWTEGDGATRIDPNASVSDPDGSGDVADGSVTVQVTGNAQDNDELAIDTDGDFSINSGDLVFNSTTIGTVTETSGTDGDGTVTGGDALTVDLNGKASEDNVGALAQAVTFRNTTDQPGSDERTVELSVTDGSGDTGSATSAVAVTPVNDAPTVDAATVGLDTVEQNASDPDGMAVSDVLGKSGVNLSDPDTDTAQVGTAVTGVQADNGTFEFSTDSGETWQDFADLSAVSQESAVLLAPEDKLRFLPDEEDTGDPLGGNTLTLRAWDGTVGTTGTTSADTRNNGSSQTFSSNEVTAEVSVTDTTPPTLADSDPGDDTIAHPPGDSLVLTFDEPIDFGDSGSIDLIAPDAPSQSESFDVENDTGGGDGTVSIDGDKLTIDPSSDLIAGTRFAVQIDAGAITDEDTATGTPNDFAGIDDNDTLDFRTVGQAPQFTGDADDDGTLDEPLTVTEGDTDIDIAPLLAVGDADTGQTLSFTVTDAPTNGSLSAIADAPTGSIERQPGNAAFTPDTEFDGSDSFTVRVDDGTGTTDTVTVPVEVEGVEDDPVSENVTREIDEDQTLVFEADDFPFDDPDSGDGLAAVDIEAMPGDGEGTLFRDANGNGQPDDGEAVKAGDSIAAGTIASDGLIYQPPADANGAGFAAIDFQVVDQTDRTSDTKTLTIDVEPQPDDPVATDDEATVELNGEAQVDVLGGDEPLASDPDDGDELSVSLQSSPDNGTAQADGGTITYTPSENFSGTDSLTYIVRDGTGRQDTATLTFDVAPGNSAPVAKDDTFGVSPDETTTLAVLENDSDPDGDDLDVSLKTTPANATATPQGDGTIAFTPDDGFVGETSFTYVASDPGGETATATVTVSVNPPPEVTDDAFTVVQGREDVTLEILANDGAADDGGLTIELAEPPANGTATLTDDNTVSYTPAAGFNGTDTFTYAVTNEAGVTATAQATVEVTESASDLVAADDVLSVKEGTKTDLDLLANDQIPVGVDPSVTLQSTPDNATVSVNDDATVTFAPDAGFVGTATFGYTVRNGSGASSSATATVEVTDVNDPPVAKDDSFRITNAEPAPLDVLANDSDPDDDDLSAAITSSPANGSVRVNEAGEIVYTADAGFTGTDSFQYSVNDGRGGSATATAEVTVGPARDLVVLGGGEQTLTLPFPAEVNGTADAEGVRLEPGAIAALRPGAGDVVQLPGALTDYDVSAGGNTLVFDGADGTRAEVSLNAEVPLIFDGGSATAAVQPGPDGISLTLGGVTVGDGFDPAQVDLNPDGAGLPQGDGSGNRVILDGQSDTQAVPFAARVVGTAASETIQVPASGDVSFTGGDGDRVELARAIDAYAVEAAGNTLTISRADGATVELGLNGQVEVAFADGSAEAAIGVEDGRVRIELGGEAVGDGFDPGAVNLDPGDASALEPENAQALTAGPLDDGLMLG